MRFSVCGTCDEWRVKMYNAKSLVLRKELADDQRVHLADVRLERQAYWGKRTAARTDPTSCLSLIIDGADQAKYKFPSAWSKVTLAISYTSHCYPHSPSHFHPVSHLIWLRLASPRSMTSCSASRCT